MLSLGQLHRRNALLYPNKPALIFGDQTITFREYNLRINRLVNALRTLGFERGDRLAIFSRNCPEYMVVYGAGEKAGFPVAALNFRLARQEVEQLLRQITPKAVFVQGQFREMFDAMDYGASAPLRVLLDGPSAGGWQGLDDLLSQGDDAEPAVEVGGDDIAYLLFTSGTTGLPRAAMLSHLGQWLDATTFVMEASLTSDDRFLFVSPLYHVAARAMTLAHLMVGATIVMHEAFDAEKVLQDIEKHRITTFTAVPTMIIWLLNHPSIKERDLSSLRLLWYAASPMPVPVLEQAIATFGPILVQGYGLTESGPSVTVLPASDHRLDGDKTHRLASCGRPVVGVEIRIVGPDGQDLPPGEIGEVVVRSPYLMKGYWNEPELTAQTLRDGWLHTGDMGRLDEDGYLYLVDRKKDMIISGGENIYPREVEEVLYSHPGVREAAVIGVPDPVWGEAVKAFVVVEEGAQVTEDELIAYCAERLARYKRPKSIEFCQELPKNPSGKILKNVLREPYWRDHERKI